MSYCVNECTQGDHKSYCTNVVKFSQTFYFSSKLIHEVILTSLIDQPPFGQNLDCSQKWFVFILLFENPELWAPSGKYKPKCPTTSIM